MEINVLLYPDFETLDVFGPVEVFGKVPSWNIQYYSATGGIISNQDNVQIMTKSIKIIQDQQLDVLFIPGGTGARSLILQPDFIAQIKTLAQHSHYVLTVCTGSALLAKTGLLDDKLATSNKRSFEWVKSTSTKPQWQQKARWTRDDKYYTSSGISAGMDMALAFIRDQLDESTAEQIAYRIEYSWHKHPDEDPFCQQPYTGKTK